MPLICDPMDCGPATCDIDYADVSCNPNNNECWPDCLPSALAPDCNCGPDNCGPGEFELWP